ncbi:class I SAM-dependent methyltransferase [Nitrosomonas cryotolerans]|nr:class I SAM-dependent methyltransferase [Nitrosomonas cryotolerans]
MADQLNDMVNAPHRETTSQRDHYRHPLETLTFFDIQQDMTVVEIWPGTHGWYTEILAPYLRKKGKLYAAHFNANSTSPFYRDSRKQFLDKLRVSPDFYDKVTITSFNPPSYVDIAPAGSADRVLTFRNIHNWYMRGGGDERVLAAFSAFYRALKPGGILGVVEHRLPDTRPESDQEGSGYLRENYVIRLAEQAGFRLLAKSNINANPTDSTNHPKGVWTLPPTLRLGELQRDHYLSIGESDRMTLKFIKSTD